MPQQIVKLMLTDDEYDALCELYERECRGEDDQILYLLKAYLEHEAFLPCILFGDNGRTARTFVSVDGDLANLLIESSIVNRRSVDMEASHIVACYLTPRCARYDSMRSFKHFVRFSRGGRKKKKRQKKVTLELSPAI